MKRRSFLAALTPLALFAQASPRLRVLTYNIHHGEGIDGKFDYERLARVINSAKPDVVALQEVDRGTRRSAGVDQAARLGELTGMRAAFGVALYYEGGEYGEAILSRFPMADRKAHHLPFHQGQEPRTALEVAIRPDNGVPEFLFVGTHWCHQSNDTRTEQAEQTNRLYPAEGGPPVILAGDLNARPGSSPMNVLVEGQWVDAIAPQSRIDYILYRRADPWRVVEVTILDERVASDHRPVLAVLEWRGGVR
jgi:endonuclease/exonuclease/phosphatase family metal-dependent hydrolase